MRRSGCLGQREMNRHNLMQGMVSVALVVHRQQRVEQIQRLNSYVLNEITEEVET